MSRHGDGAPTGERVGALPCWIWRITPPGAPLVPILDVQQEPGPGCMPFIHTWQTTRLARPPSWPRAARDKAIMAGVPIGLKRPPRRSGDHNSTPRPRNGIDRWRMEAAYFHDLCDESELLIAGRLHVSLDGDRRPPSRSRTARRYVCEGRQLLSEIGAWPWCVADEGGKLEEDWWTTQRYAEALAAWHFAAFADGVDELVRPAQYAAGERPACRVVDRDLAARLYRRQFPQCATGGLQAPLAVDAGHM